MTETWLPGRKSITSKRKTLSSSSESIISISLALYLSFQAIYQAIYLLTHTLSLHLSSKFPLNLLPVSIKILCLPVTRKKSNYFHQMISKNTIYFWVKHLKLSCAISQTLSLSHTLRLSASVGSDFLKKEVWFPSHIYLLHNLTLPLFLSLSLSPNPLPADVWF